MAIQILTITAIYVNNARTPITVSEAVLTEVDGTLGVIPLKSIVNPGVINK